MCGKGEACVGKLELGLVMMGAIVMITAVVY